MKFNLRLEAYPFAIRPLSEDDGGGFLIEFPDAPGVISDGETLGEAIANGRAALQAALLTRREFGDPVPAPGARASASGHGASAFRRRCTPASRSTLVTSMIAEGLGQRSAPRRKR